ncbi:DUF2537 domain-containing protein [Nocardia sp. NPDC005366]|uniref:DUF2537 domain-containing protein n=1 Tax=Nocardia sp. NPDC005366 TaxID=3156878 RepID=UPI0033AF5F76
MKDNGAYEPYRPYPEYRDPTPWAAGITVAVMVALLMAAAVYSFGEALARVHPVLAVLVNLIAAGGATPSAWRWRTTPVARWVLAGVASGVVLAWSALIIAGLSSL